MHKLNHEVSGVKVSGDIYIRQPAQLGGVFKEKDVSVVL